VIGLALSASLDAIWEDNLRRLVVGEDSRISRRGLRKSGCHGEDMTRRAVNCVYTLYSARKLGIDALQLWQGKQLAEQQGDRVDEQITYRNKAPGEGDCLYMDNEHAQRRERQSATLAPVRNVRVARYGTMHGRRERYCVLVGRQVNDEVIADSGAIEQRTEARVPRPKLCHDAECDSSPIG